MTQKARSNSETLALLWKELKEALRGSEADYTQISLRKAVFLLSVPMILELVLESVFAVVDIFFVGKLGSSAIATVGITETFLFLLYSVAMGLATAVTALIARRVGEKNAEKSSLTAVQSILLALLFSLPIGVLGVLFSPDLLLFMGADAWTLSQGVSYTRWMLGGNLVIFLIFLLNAVFRGDLPQMHTDVRRLKSRSKPLICVYPRSSVANSFSVPLKSDSRRYTQMDADGRSKQNLLSAFIRVPLWLILSLFHRRDLTTEEIVIISEKFMNMETVL